MSRLTSRDRRRLAQWIDLRRPGYSLPGPFYYDPLVYEADIESIWRRGWLFAGHACEAAQPGDWFAIDVGDDPLLIVRDDDGNLHALDNICRHRGTILKDGTSGHLGRIVCPYHQWTYARDGTLVSCRGMHSEPGCLPGEASSNARIDKRELGLRRAHLLEIEGLVFISLADEPPDARPLVDMFTRAARPQGLSRAKVATVVDYEVHANWKLVWENNRECYHCNANHPQYIKANFDHYNADDTRRRIRREIESVTRRSEEQWASAGLSATHKSTGMAPFPDPQHGVWYSANRTVLAAGYVSESMDGRQVAPLMGEYTSADVGTLRMRTMPNFWNHSSCDHAVSTRLLPAGPQKTFVRVTWLVDSGAVEGKDYELAEIMPFWQLTSEQDWVLCERAQRGVRSRRYTPGPYSTHKEYNVDAMVRWYLGEVARAAESVETDESDGPARPVPYGQ